MKLKGIKRIYMYPCSFDRIEHDFNEVFCAPMGQFEKDPKEHAETTHVFIQGVLKRESYLMLNPDTTG